MLSSKNAVKCIDFTFVGFKWHVFLKAFSVHYKRKIQSNIQCLFVNENMTTRLFRSQSVLNVG